MITIKMKDNVTRTLPKGNVKASVWKRIISRRILKRTREKKLNLLYSMLRVILPKSIKVTKQVSNSKDFSVGGGCSSSLMADLPAEKLQVLKASELRECDVTKKVDALAGKAE
ncbi:uncharacterized protein LOC131067671 [Cryptomeria japonica]|uniref:uncharacterized protein LOC131067671 n=1 Tax=Cryptomeria japonica TaxID=3369 RepID=UPI0027DA03C6|nr:uncharacterized protein LOC131067671 [Cryptomeria japonica]